MSRLFPQISFTFGQSLYVEVTLLTDRQHSTTKLFHERTEEASRIALNLLMPSEETECFLEFQIHNPFTNEASFYAFRVFRALNDVDLVFHFIDNQAFITHGFRYCHLLV